VQAPAVVEAREDRIRLGPFVEQAVVGPILPEGVLLVALGRGEPGVGFTQEGAVVILARSDAPFLVCLEHRRGEQAPPAQLFNRLDGVGERPALLGECPDLGELARHLRAQRREFLVLRGEHRRHAQFALSQPAQLPSLGVVEGPSEW
jgi:hypothetical protein